MKKRIMILSLVMVIIISSVFGCGTESTEPVSTPVVVENDMAASEENTETEVEAVEEVEEVVEPEYGDFDGFLWEVKNENATVYLFGSIHIANDELFPFSEKVETAFAESDHLGVEIDLTDQEATLAVQPKLLYGADDNIFNHLSEEGVTKFREAAAALGVQAEMLQQLKIWVVGSSISQLQLAKAGYAGAAGVDMYFLNKAKEIDKPIIELEGIDMQVDLINGFTDEEQEATFFTFQTEEETIEDFEALYNVFLTGDEDQATAFLFEDDGEESLNNVEDKLLKERNIGMADRIEEYLQTDDTYFVVVGLAHYLGEDSVIKYLNEKGYTVERK